MTPDERNMLTDLANKVAQTQPPAHDAEAEDFIRTHIGNRPDALYLMTQTVLIQNLALQHAQQQIQELQQRSGQPAPSSSPSGSFLGRPNPAPSGGSGYQQTPTGAGPQAGYAPPPPQYASQPQYAAPTPMPSQGGTGSFLKGAAQTAAGVAAGALAFEGIESLFHGFGHGGGMGSGLGGFGGGGFGGGGFSQPGGETIVNNYYDSPGGGDTDLSDRFTDNRDDYQAAGISDDVDSSSSVDDSSQFDDSADNSGSFDDSSSGDTFA